MQTNKNNVRIVGGLLVLPALALILSGCGKSVSQIVGEGAAEALIEGQSGGAADVDINGNNVKVNTAEGSFESGENVSLPENFPADVFVLDGKRIAAVASDQNNSFSVSVESDKSAGDISALYQEKFRSAGWKISGTMNYGGSTSVIAEKDARTAAVVIAESGGKTIVTITVGNK